MIREPGDLPGDGRFCSRAGCTGGIRIERNSALPSVMGDNRLYGPFLHWGDGAPGSRTGEEVYFSIRANRADQLYAGFYNAGVSTVDFLTLDRWYHVVWTRVYAGPPGHGPCQP